MNASTRVYVKPKIRYKNNNERTGACNCDNRVKNDKCIITSIANTLPAKNPMKTNKYRDLRHIAPNRT